MSNFHIFCSCENMNYHNLRMFEDHAQPLIGKLRKWGCDASPTFKYWDMFLVAVQIMLLNVRAEREGDWSAHLMSS